MREACYLTAWLFVLGIRISMVGVLTHMFSDYIGGVLFIAGVIMCVTCLPLAVLFAYLVKDEEEKDSKND